MKLWGGRFQKNTDHEMDDFHSSIGFDHRLFREDIAGSRAHAQMLARQGIISQEDQQAIDRGLASILTDMEAGRIDFPPESEDIHMRVEELLTERVGEPGKRLHTGRSRNDQVALDMRLYAKETAAETMAAVRRLCELLLSMAEAHVHDIMPGYTHLQQAQPITLGHYLMAYFQMFSRDLLRFENAYQAADVSPLGSGALAGAAYPLDRAFVAEALGLSRITLNSLDGVSDRDFLLDYLAAASICMMHLSRFCEECVLYSSAEFGFLAMDDSFSTGSSMMPQKKNPDVAELVRGKTGRVYGDLTALLTVMKSLPLAYNKDMQEDKESYFDARDTLLQCLGIFTDMLASATYRTDVMRRKANLGFSNATDCADDLVRKGGPFRDAHRITGELVAYCLDQGKALLDLEAEELARFSPVFSDDVYEALSPEACVAARDIPGGPAPRQVLAAIEAGKALLRSIPVHEA